MDLQVGLSIRHDWKFFDHDHLQHGIIYGLDVIERNTRSPYPSLFTAEKNHHPGRLLKQMNDELLVLNRAIAILEWQSATSPSSQVSGLNAGMSRFKTTWRNTWCSRMKNLGKESNGLGFSEKRMIRLLCRGPKYTPYQARALTSVFEKLSSSYANALVCRSEEHDEQKCYHGEPELERLVATSRNESELRWAWVSWRNEMSKVKGLFTTSVALQNQGAWNNGYLDIGECWREELETSDLENVVEDLYRQIEPLYKLLHAVARFRLVQKYPDIVDPRGPIPAHLLGNMWAQNWASLIDIIWPRAKDNGSVTGALKRKNVTVTKMVKLAEDFYVSMGLPQLTSSFWENSVFERENRSEIACHGTAANMYRDNDYRILICAEVNAEDFYVIHHELGHVYYYMAYKDQPTIFMDGANSAFHEAVGDAVMYGVMTPQHMQRLGLISDSTPDDDLPFLLRQALSKVPQLPHSLVIDKWRWKVFNGEIKSSEYNEAWWAITRRYQGIEPPLPRSDFFFDPAAKFHVTDNTPYVRYFLGYILQVQIFKGMCEAAVTGKVGDPNFDIPLHRCDIYGSKNAGNKLKHLMELGSSMNWKYPLFLATGTKNYRVEPFLEYYEPIYRWLKLQVKYYDIPVGWDEAISNVA
ncbi:angiotensin-converting enzyme-like [Neodiprion lecontei]|uniref:Angiotensin-converting enzyme n=1 Tax=Neodiprion lecontei TaxID=441921 RepID=A0ABM3FY38_NEOLC|nr:angiotensin-converting enzyme-like [Neodiprion lecontei]